MNSAQEHRPVLILRTIFVFCAVFVLLTATSYERVNVFKNKSEPARALSHMTSELSTPPAYEQEEKCVDPDGVPVGPGGNQDNTYGNAFVGTIFERRGNECPCSYVQTKCEINDLFYGKGDCGSLVIDGIAAAADGYPEVDITHTLKICNYNDSNNITLVQSNQPAKVEFFYPINGTNSKKFLVDESYNGQVLNPGECREEIGTTTVSTNRAKYYMKAILQGPQNKNGNEVHKGFCFAYSFNKIDFKYDYGLGKCKVNTQTSCFLADGSGRSCEDYINSLDYVCTPFNATFTGKACNDNNRDIQLQVGASNYKINTYNQKADGTYKKEKKSLPGVMPAGSCAAFKTTKMVDPCKPNFWQVNIHGSLFNPNAENGWVFKDKDCHSFTFAKLFIVDPLGLSSDSPTVAPTTIPTASPTSSSKPSACPTSQPTLSTRPSLNPTASPTLSSKPSGRPTSQPTLSIRPSANPTVSPSVSNKPSASPSKGKSQKGKSPSKKVGRKQRNRN